MESTAETFKPGDLVTWQYLLGTYRAMSPDCITVMVEICIMTGWTTYVVSRVEEMSEAERKMVGHHQGIWIIDPNTQEEIPRENPLSGAHFVKIGG